jgi:flavin reductase (DIM6/NTAB) family NADH-FMN oxidoreductase RutF
MHVALDLKVLYFGTPVVLIGCPIQLECTVDAAHRFGERATAFQVSVVRAYVEEGLIVPGTHYVDPVRWDPLIMKFCEFFGGGATVHPSRLAEGWRMPHELHPAR